MKKIHVCLVSGQPIPNLIPLKMEGLRPDKVILLESPNMGVQAQRLAGVIKSWGITVERFPIEPFDLESARNTCLNLLAGIENEDVILNVTGGTKLMAFAAFEVFREMGKPLIYVDTQNSTVQLIGGQSIEKREFSDIIKVKPYLASYGQNVFEKADPQMVDRHKALFAEIVKNVGRYEQAVSTLNRLASPLRRVTTLFPCEVIMDEQAKTTPEFKELLLEFIKNGVVELRDDTIHFPSIKEAEFASGGWLEEYAYYTVSSIIHRDYVCMGLKVQWDQRGAKPPTNEYDVVFTHKNKLYLIECKTGLFEGANRETLGSEVVYKLDSLKDSAGGLYGKAMIVSFRPLTDDMKKRIEANRIKFCEGSNLKLLPEKIKQWIRE